ncbi:MAG: DUF2225 domain-containing protein [Peptococcaceae bacterium]|nr:DUF2225 domain-containing protein [Peptococcaceae bacterium]
MTTDVNSLYEKKVTCLNCAKPFKTMKVRSSFCNPVKTDSDFFVYYDKPENNPYYYAVSICPECGFAFTDQFSNYFSVKAKEQISSQITQQWQKQNFGLIRDFPLAVASYKLALYAAELKEEKQLVIAGLSLRLAGLYRAQNDVEQEKRFLEIALEHYITAYSQGEPDRMSEPKILYLIGELSRRVGLYQQATLYFSKVVEHPNRNSDLQSLKLAREQWLEIKEHLANQ